MEVKATEARWENVFQVIKPQRFPAVVIGNRLWDVLISHIF